jgi:hypothetical protein
MTGNQMDKTSKTNPDTLQKDEPMSLIELLDSGKWQYVDPETGLLMIHPAFLPKEPDPVEEMRIVQEKLNASIALTREPITVSPFVEPEWMTRAIAESAQWKAERLEAERKRRLSDERRVKLTQKRLEIKSMEPIVKQRIGSHKYSDKERNKSSICNLTADYVMELMVACDNCPICGDELLWRSEPNCRWIWSIDRLDNDVGHVKGNVRITCVSCNLRMRHWAVPIPQELAKLYKRSQSCGHEGCHDATAEDTDQRIIDWKANPIISDLDSLIKTTESGLHDLYRIECRECYEILPTRAKLVEHMAWGTPCAPKLDSQQLIYAEEEYIRAKEGGIAVMERIALSGRPLGAPYTVRLGNDKKRD